MVSPSTATAVDRATRTASGSSPDASRRPASPRTTIAPNGSPSSATSGRPVATPTSSVTVARPRYDASVRPSPRVSRSPAATSAADGVGHGVEALAHDVLAPGCRAPRLGAQHEAVRERRHGDRLHVVGHDEVAPGERGPRTRQLEQRQRAARAGADLAPSGSARVAGDEVDDVARRRPAPTCTSSTARLQAAHGRRRRRRRRARPRRCRAERAASSISRSSSAARVARRAARSRKRSSCASGSGYVPSYSIGFCVASTRNGRGERVGDAVDGDLALLHRLEQRRLGLRRGAVDLVGEEQVREDRARAGTRSSPCAGSKTDEPVTSDGIRSGVNWMRAKRQRRSRWRTSGRAASWPRPGTSSSSTWPSASSAERARARATSRLPTTARSTSSRIASAGGGDVVTALPCVDVSAHVASVEAGPGRSSRPGRAGGERPPGRDEVRFGPGRRGRAPAGRRGGEPGSQLGRGRPEPRRRRPPPRRGWRSAGRRCPTTLQDSYPASRPAAAARSEVVGDNVAPSHRSASSRAEAAEHHHEDVDVRTAVGAAGQRRGPGSSDGGGDRGEHARATAGDGRALHRVACARTAPARPARRPASAAGPGGAPRTWPTRRAR